MNDIQKNLPSFSFRYHQSISRKPSEKRGLEKELKAILSLLPPYSNQKIVKRPSFDRSCRSSIPLVSAQRDLKRPRARSCLASIPPRLPGTTPLQHRPPPRHRMVTVLIHKIFTYLALILKLLAVMAFLFPFSVRFRIETRSPKPSANFKDRIQTCSWDEK